MTMTCTFVCVNPSSDNNFPILNMLDDHTKQQNAHFKTFQEKKNVFIQEISVSFIEITFFFLYFVPMAKVGQINDINAQIKRLMCLG